MNSRPGHRAGGGGATKKIISARKATLEQWAMKSATMVLSHPFEYAKILIQLGYEPMPPTVGKYFGSPILYLPNVFEYLKYIKSVDGLSGCYRGFIPRFYSSSIYYAVTQSLAMRCPITKNYDEEFPIIAAATGERQRPRSGKKTIFMASSEAEFVAKEMCWEVLCVSAGAVVSQPFQVVAVRAMAQFVGRETRYDSLWASIMDIFKTEGITGFFRGLTPRIVGESVYVIITAAVLYAIRKTVQKEKLPPLLASLGSSIAANAFSYQFSVVSNTMIINGSGLALGGPPHTPLYSSWIEAWLTLKKAKQLSRGSAVLGRFYQGAYSDIGGVLRPVGNFGPLHPIGLARLEELERAKYGAEIVGR